jgi:uncharacterized membrane protein
MGRILEALILILYPAIVAVGMTFFGIRITALILLALLGRRIIAMMLKNREGTRVILYQAIIIAAVIAIAGLIESPFALRVSPFIISLSIITLFAASLRSTPIIERFARLQKPELPEPEVIYCRKLTKVWIGILAANSTLVLVAAFIEDNITWTLLVGPVSYSLIGLAFIVEYPYRKWRFQDFDDKSPIDRILKKVVER